MQEIGKDEVEKLLAKYKTQLEVNLAPEDVEVQKIGVIRTREYNEFKQEYMPKHMGFYEKACQFAEKTLKITPDAKKGAALQASIDICHLTATPVGVYSLSFLFPAAYIVVGVFLSYLLTGGGMFFPAFFLITGAILIMPLGSAPHFMANSWRMKASNQMVLSIFYVVTYMRHTSNLELAIDFAAEHLTPPLSLDFKRVIWNIETGKCDSVKESLDQYLDTWREWNMEFIEAMHLVEGSLLEGDDSARLAMLDKGLDVILEETYEKMLHYAHNLKSPITMLNMLGVILPILGLVILPLVVSFMEGVHWYHLATLYNVILPASVYYLGRKVLSTRPTGYGSVDISKNPELQKYRNFVLKIGDSEILISPMYLSLIVAAICLFIAFIPLIIHILNPGWDIMLTRDGAIKTITAYEHEDAKFYLIGYKMSQAGDAYIGPFGLGAAILSSFMPLAAGLSLGLYYRTRTTNVLKIRTESKRLEEEFASALFQLGNRLGDGYPAEIAFEKVASAIPNTVSGQFFGLVSSNIQRLGMSVEQAIFDPSNGAILQYPSDLIETSMKVLIESARKGPLVAAQALINVSRYIKSMHSVDERLKDLLADSISSMNSQIKFLTPVISAIVIGITSMVTTILNKLSTQLTKLQNDSSAAQAGGAGGTLGLTSLFGDGMPTFYFQIIVGFYVVQITYILTILVNGIENGADQLGEDYSLGQNMTKSTLIYIMVSCIVMLLFNMIAGNIVGNEPT